MTLTISICDDEQVEIKYLTMLINKWAVANEHRVVIKTFESAEAFLFRYTEDKNTDILLLDIEMGKMNGVELAQHIRRDNESMQIVFITGFPDFMAQGYEVSALHYLMKSVREEKLFSVLDKACKSLSRAERVIILNINGEIIRISVSDILSVEAFAHAVTIETKGGLYHVKQSITEIEHQLGGGFIRCHRSYIVGLKHIKRITKAEVILDNNRALPLSRRSYDKVNQAFIQFFKGG